MDISHELGATYLGNGRCRFCVWAPYAERVAVHITSPADRVVPLAPTDHGYHSVEIDDVFPGSAYLYRIDGAKERPDPASRSQPHGVHSASEVIDAAFGWTDNSWRGLPLEEYIIYEIHVGTFTGEGTFGAIIPHLSDLKRLGITAVELMPVAQFPGKRNWGYDGVYPFAAQDSYGGPTGLKVLVDACHARGLAVIQDVVYNHSGPEGNYLSDFGPYFTDRYRTPWGEAVNFDGPYSDGVRDFFVQNALHWVRDFHIDALRLDAVHAIIDVSARPFLEELAESVHGEAARLGRRIYLMPESDRDDPRLVRPPEAGGLGLDAVWNDDFHHALHTELTGEQSGYYVDFNGLPALTKALSDGFVYTGQYSRYRRRRHGNSAGDLPTFRFVVFAQNHDQVGNRMLGERLSALVSFERLKLAAATVLISPFVPLLFMGEEYGETAPFLYFTDHSDPGLVRGVREGRRQEFAAFAWRGEPPDPQNEATFLRSKLNHELRSKDEHVVLYRFYAELLRLRKTMPPSLGAIGKGEVVTTIEAESVFSLNWREPNAVAVFNFGKRSVKFHLPSFGGRWEKKLDSAEERWLGRGSELPGDLDASGPHELGLSPESVAVYMIEVAA